MAQLISIFERTLILSIETAWMVGLLCVVSAVIGRKLAPLWQYALWMLVIVKLLFPWIPGNPGSGLQWLHLPHLFESYTSPGEQAAALDPILGTGGHSALLPVDAMNAREGAVHISAVDTNGVDKLFLQNVTVIWLIGIAAVGCYFVIGNMMMSSALRRTSSYEVPLPLQEQFMHICRRSGIRSSIDLRITDAVSSPTLYGLFSPTIFIPRSLVGRLSSADWDHVFQHELIHYRRKDVWVNMLFSLLAVFHWFNPAVWYGLRRLRIAQEEACDASVLSTTGQRESYASSILKVAEFGARRQSGAAGIGFSTYKNQLVRRITMIHNFQSRKKRVSILGIAVLMTAALLALPSAFAEGDEATAAGQDIVFSIPSEGQITAAFGEHIHPKTNERIFHDGIDIVNEEGSEVRAAADGQVIKADYHGDYGLHIVIEHRDGWRTEYRHLQELLAAEGDAVKTGDRIGLMGSTGKSTGPHLHFSIMKDNVYVDLVQYTNMNPN